MEIMNEKNSKKASIKLEQLLQIEIEHSIIVIELEQKLQKYHLPGLNHSGFFKARFKTIETIDRNTTQNPLELIKRFG